MVKKARKVGTGITGYTQEVYEEPLTEEEREEQEEGLKNFFQKDFSFEGLHAQPLERLCREILREAGRDPDDFKDFKYSREEPDTREAYAIRIIEKIRWWRKFAERGDLDMASRFAIELGSLVMEAYSKARLEAVALEGLQFRKGRKKDRWDALSLLMREEYEALLKRPDPTTARKLAKHLHKKYFPDFSLEDDGVIFFRYQGREKQITFSTFQDRLTNIRKKLKKLNRT